jgi:hypothetical protein
MICQIGQLAKASDVSEIAHRVQFERAIFFEDQPSQSPNDLSCALEKIVVVKNQTAGDIAHLDAPCGPALTCGFSAVRISDFQLMSYLLSTVLFRCLTVFNALVA